MKLVTRTAITFVVLMSLAMMAAASQSRTHQKKPSAKTLRPGPVQPLAMSAAPGALGPMVGTWSLRDGDKPRTDIKMVFRPNGTFAFVGPNWQSIGKFRVQEHKLCLEWTAVDGAKVAPGTMKKDFAMADDESSFTIDKYTYYKLHK